MGTNYALFISGFFLFCTEGVLCLTFTNLNCMTYVFTDTSQYLDDIFTIDNSEFEKHILDIYQAELWFDKANTSDKEASFLDLIIKAIGSDIHSSVYNIRDDFGFPIVNSPG